LKGPRAIGFKEDRYDKNNWNKILGNKMEDGAMKREIV
jgi:hypothetical protein